MPAGNRPHNPEDIAKLKADYRSYREAAKQSFFGVPDARDTEDGLRGAAKKSARRPTRPAGTPAA